MAGPTLHDEVASAIGRQVEQMILQAKQDSEARVKHELARVRDAMEAMEQQITQLSDRVSECKPSQPDSLDSSQTVDRNSLSQALQALELRWGAEMKALKQDLHRTILAHNHNSDLLKHHKDALDEVRRKIESQSQPRQDQIDAQLTKVDRMLRQGQAKQRTLDALCERLDTLEAHVAELMPGHAAMGAAAGYPAVSMGAGMQGMQQALPAAAKKPAKSTQPPTDEEVRQRLLRAAQGNKAGGSDSLRSEAPVFVPSGAPAAAFVDPTVKAVTAGDTAVAQEEAPAVAKAALAGDSAAAAEEEPASAENHVAEKADAAAP